MPTIELREHRARLAAQARAIADKHQNGDPWGAEDETEFDRLHQESERLKTQIERAERQEALDAELRASQGTIAGAADSQGSEPGSVAPDLLPAERQEARYREAFGAYLRYGLQPLPPEQRQIIAGRQTSLTPEQRALATGLDTAGGFTVAVDNSFMGMVETALLAFGGVRNAGVSIIRTATGADLPMPTGNDTGNKGVRISENQIITEQDVTFGQKVLHAYLYSSKIIRVPYTLLQDTGFPLESWLAERLGERIGRILAEEMTTGSGAAMPEGIVTASTQGIQGASATAIVYDDLVDLEHSIDPAYRAGAQFLFHDTTLKALKKLKDGEGRPLWSPGLAQGAPDTILGYRYVISQEMATPAASAKTILFGDMSKFYIRDVLDMQMLRLVERYAEYLQVAFLLYSRHDSGLLDAGTHPVKHFAQAA